MNISIRRLKYYLQPGKSMKRIGIDARLLLRPLRGMPLYITRLCQYLPALNRNYTYFLFINRGFEHNAKPDNYQHVLNEMAEKNSNVNIINCDDDAEVLWEQVYLPRLVKKHKIDLLLMPANRTCFFPGVPTIVTLHDVMEYLYLKEEYLRGPKTVHADIKTSLYKARMDAYIWASYKFGFKRATRIITVSQYSASDIANYLKISKDNITAIHHGIDNEFICNSVDSPYGFNLRTHVLMLGGDSHHKNPEGAIAAWSNVPKNIRNKYPLKVIGFCGGTNSTLIQALKKYNLEKEVEVNGWVSQEALIDYLRKAVLFLYLSRYEGFGFPILQAMASGTPVISTDKSSIPEVLGETGFKFDPEDHTSIAAGIEKLVLDRTLWADQSVSGITRANMFTWKTSAEKHLEVFNEILR